MEKLSLQEAMADPFRDMLSFDSVSIAPAMMQGTVRLWQWRCGLTDDSPATLLRAAERDVHEDPALFFALQDRQTFGEWFAKEDLEPYCMTEATGGEAWADTVRTRSCGLRLVHGGKN